MCLAIPGKVTEIDRSVTPVMGNVNFNGITRRVCLEWLPDLQVGEYVIVHVGFAISKLDEREALETLNLIAQMSDLAPEPGEDGVPPERGE